MCTSLDGYVTTPDGWPAQLADPDFSPARYGFVEFQQRCDAVLMGRNTFEPALGAPQWPWGDLDVFVLGSTRPAGTPDHVVVDDDPQRLLEQVRETIVLPFLLGDGLRLTPAVSTDTSLALESTRRLPGGRLEVTYACR